MTQTERGHWSTALVIAALVGLLLYGVLFLQPAATFATMPLSIAALFAMKKGWLPTHNQRGR